MANAQLEITTVKKVVEVEEEVKRVSLNLSMEEAITLRRLLLKVYGDSNKSYRKFTNSIFNALCLIPDIQGSPENHFGVGAAIQALEIH